MSPTTCIRRSTAWSGKERVKKSGRLAMKRGRSITRRLSGILLAIALMTACWPVDAQMEAGCGPDGYRVFARRWDAILKMGWELKQDCAHPQWPSRSVAVGTVSRSGVVRMSEIVPTLQPLLVRAGDRVRLWMQDATVRIQMDGVSEQSARIGERVMIQVTRQAADAGMTVERIAGIVRAAGDVEMER